MTQVTVDANWRLNGVTFNMMRGVPANIFGMTEVLMTAPEGSVFGKAASTTGVGVPGTTVNRNLEAVLAETVDVGGTTISMQMIVDALPLFFERWRIEDAEAATPAAGVPGAPILPGQDKPNP